MKRRTHMKAENVLKLRDLLTGNTIEVNIYAHDWKDAIRKSGQLLLGIDAVKPEYIDAMIRFCEENQAYIVLAPGIALPHARPEDGVKKMCLSLITLERPVNFGHPQNDPVDIVIALGAIDHSSHINALSQLAELLMEEENIEAIRSAKTKTEILELFQRNSKKNLPRGA